MSSQRDPEHVVEHLLVLRAQLGSAEAHARLFRTYRPRLTYYVRRLLGNEAEAEELVQETWMRVVRHVGQLEHPEAFRTWVYRIARNLAISTSRRLRRERSFLETEESLAEAPQTEDRLDVFQGFTAAEVHSGLEQLSTAHREVLTLRFIEDLPYEAIAEIVGCTVGTVRSRLHYAKRALRQAMEKR